MKSEILEFSGHRDGEKHLDFATCKEIGGFHHFKEIYLTEVSDKWCLKKCKNDTNIKCFLSKFQGNRRQLLEGWG